MEDLVPFTKVPFWYTFLSHTHLVSRVSALVPGLRFSPVSHATGWLVGHRGGPEPEAQLLSRSAWV